MRFLILGCSDIVNRRVFPALENLVGLQNIEIASRRKQVPAGSPALQSCIGTHGFGQALESSQADCVYISTENSEHGVWVQHALRNGFHVIVDKPAFMDRHEWNQCVALAKEKRLCLAESLVYGFHPQIAKIRSLFEQHHDEPARLVAMFTVPLFQPQNFRLDPKRGGGALWDLGPYASSLCRIFWNESPIKISREISKFQSGLDQCFDVMMTTPSGRSIVGHFGFGEAYTNRIHIIGKKISLEVNRFFSTPPGFRAPSTINGTTSEPLTMPAGDSFFEFLKSVKMAIECDRLEDFWDPLNRDQKILYRLREGM